MHISRIRLGNDRRKIHFFHKIINPSNTNFISHFMHFGTDWTSTQSSFAVFKNFSNDGTKFFILLIYKLLNLLAFHVIIKGSSC